MDGGRSPPATLEETVGVCKGDDLASLKAQVARDFPGWHLIVSDRGRWWALRGPVGSDGPLRFAPGDVSANSFEELYGQLGEVNRKARQRVGGAL